MEGPLFVRFFSIVDKYKHDTNLKETLVDMIPYAHNDEIVALMIENLISKKKLLPECAELLARLLPRLKNNKDGDNNAGETITSPTLPAAVVGVEEEENKQAEDAEDDETKETENEVEEGEGEEEEEEGPQQQQPQQQEQIINQILGESTILAYASLKHGDFMYAKSPILMNGFKVQKKIKLGDKNMTFTVELNYRIEKNREITEWIWHCTDGTTVREWHSPGLKQIQNLEQGLVAFGIGKKDIPEGLAYFASEIITSPDTQALYQKYTGV
jgi:hypothetical protein